MGDDISVTVIATGFNSPARPNAAPQTPIFENTVPGEQTILDFEEEKSAVVVQETQIERETPAYPGRVVNGDNDMEIPAFLRRQND
jgi:hypothetical protein